IKLGLSETKTMDIIQLDSKLDSTVEGVKIDLEALKNGKSESISFNDFSLSDDTIFKIERGKRITRKQINKNSGNIPVISSSGQEDVYLGFISKKWLEDNKHQIYNKPLITINADGSVGDVFIRREPEYTVIDVVNLVELLHEKLDQTYVMYAIKEAIAKAGYKYQAKLYIKRLKTLNIRIPVDEKGKFDFDLQKQLAQEYERLAEIKKTIAKFSKEIEDTFITIK
ncbi:restriction endonuclease subunit S, partial [Candidatus Woesearchaeota archaeon]|nr:restriction endonuclease subunit S [Candidatus Woesearchaeota archaeon]